MNETLKMPSIMQSINPKYCELIASGKKTIEVRKTKPKISTPFKVYIYCTKARIPIRHNGRILMYEDDLAITNRWGQGKRVENPCGSMMDGELFLNGKVIGEYICNEVSEHNWLSYRGDYGTDKQFNFKLCLSYGDLNKYGNKKTLYAWHISDLKIYDKPKELSEFYVVDNEAVKQCEYRNKCYINPYLTNGGWLNGTYSCSYNGEHEFCTKCKVKPLTRPPQSWCYVEEV